MKTDYISGVIKTMCHAVRNKQFRTEKLVLPFASKPEVVGLRNTYGLIILISEKCMIGLMKHPPTKLYLAVLEGTQLNLLLPLCSRY